MRLDSTIVASALVLLVSASGCSDSGSRRLSLDPSDYPLRFSPDESTPLPSVSKEVQFDDLDNDGVDEKIIVSHGRNSMEDLLHVESLNGGAGYQTAFQTTLTTGRVAQIEFQTTADLNGDGRKEIILIVDDESTSTAAVYDVYGKRRIWAHALFTYPQRGGIRFGDIGINVLGVISRSGRHLLLCRYVSSSAHLDHQPRRIAAVEFGSGAVVWERHIGSWPAMLILRDVTGDRVPEIFIATEAPDKGLDPASGFDRSVSRLFAFDADGRDLFPPHVFGNNMNALIVSFGGRGGEGSSGAWIDCLKRARVAGDTQTMLERISLPEGRLLSRRALTVLPLDSNPVPSFDTPDGVRYVFPTGKKSFAFFDADYRPIRSFGTETGIGRISSLDLWGDAEKEIVVTLDADRHIVIDTEGDPVAMMTGAAAIAAGANPFREPAHTVVVRSKDRHLTGTMTSNPDYYVARVGTVLMLMLAAVIPVGTLLYLLYLAVFHIALFRAATAKTATGGTLVLNRRGRIVRVTDGFRSLVEFRRTPHPGMPLKAALGGEVLSRIEEIVGKCRTQEAEVESRLATLFGSGRTEIGLSATPIQWRRYCLGVLITATDLTRILQTDRAINWALVAQNLAHEMKTPLSTVWFTLQRLRQIGGDGGGKGEELIRSVETELRRLDGFVRGFMKLANLNPPNLQPASINEALEGTLQTFRVSAPSSVEIRTSLAESLPDVPLDVNLFTVAVRNLLDNAVAAMDGEGVLRVSTYLAQNVQESWVCLAVADTGAGIPEEAQARLFTPYFSRSEGGTGLGLVISRKILDEHGGDIRFTSKEGLGSEFTLRFPVADRRSGVLHG